jgi:3-oxoadipate enol-lactonase
MKFVSIGGVLTHYSVEGPEDGRPLVFVNSLGLDLRMWDDVASILRSNYRVVRYDMRGHGLSDCPPAPYSLDQFVSDLHSLFEYLSLPSAALIGISIGGMVAMEFAAAHPDLVSYLVLIDTAARIGSADSWEARIEEVESKELEGMTSVILPIWFSSSFTEQQPAIHRGYRNSLVSTPLEGYAGACAALRDADLTERVTAIEAETLVITGDQDTSTPPDQGRALAEAIPGARFELLEGAGHLSTVEQPESAAKIMRTFLEAQDYD